MVEMPMQICRVIMLMTLLFMRIQCLISEEVWLVENHASYIV